MDATRRGLLIGGAALAPGLAMTAETSVEPIFVDCGKPNLAFQKTLATMGVEVRVFDSPAHPTWIRVGAASPAELDDFATVLPKALKA